MANSLLAIAWLTATAGCGSGSVVVADPPFAAAWMSDRGADTWLAAPASRRLRRSSPHRSPAGRRATAARARVTRAGAERPVSERPVSERPVSERPVSERPAAKPAAPGHASSAPSSDAAPPRAVGSVQPPDQRARQRVSAALRLLDRTGNADRPFVDEVLHAAGQGVVVSRTVEYAAALFAQLEADGRLVARNQAAPGDIVFFRDTLDVNGNRKPDDGITLAAVVERVEAERILVIARRGGRVRRLAIAPDAPDSVRNAKGIVVNTRLVQWPGEPRARTTGHCFAAYARP